MSMKQQLRLKTVDFADLIGIRTQFSKSSKHSIGADTTYKNTIRHKTQAGARLPNVLILAKKQSFIRSKIQHLLDEGSPSPVTPHSKPSLRQFPKRQKTIKNSNPYRFFQTSKTERVSTQSRVVTEPILHINLTKIVMEQSAYRLKSSSIASRMNSQINTQSDMLQSRKNQRLKSPFKKKEQSFSKLQPWNQEGKGFTMN